MDFNSIDLKKEYEDLVVQRRCGLRNVLQRIENLRDINDLDGAEENSLVSECKTGCRPFGEIKSRIKSYESACEKINRRGYEMSAEGFARLPDIAGIRIITPYQDDVYVVRDLLHSLDDGMMSNGTFRIVAEEDYIEKPKKNGYRSLHLNVETKIPVKKNEEPIWIPVEVQIRTKAMDLWASIEHELKYKNPHPSCDTEAKLLNVANYLSGFEKMIINLRDTNEEEALGIEDLADLSLLHSN